MTVLSRYLEAVTNSDIPVRVGQSVFYTYYKPEDVKNMVRERRPGPVWPKSLSVMG